METHIFLKEVLEILARCLKKNRDPFPLRSQRCSTDLPTVVFDEDVLSARLKFFSSFEVKKLNY